MFDFSETASKTASKKPEKKSKTADKSSKDVIKPVTKAVKAKKAVLRGVHDKRTRKVRTSVQFRRPRTLRLKRAPKYPRKSVPKTPTYV